MSLTRSILDYLRGLHESRIMLGSPGVLLPFVLFAALQCLIVYALGFFTAPPLSSFMIPIVERLGGEEALHYPSHLILLPGMYHIVYLPLSVVVGFVLYGWAVFLMGDYYERNGSRVAPRPSFRASIPAMIAIGLLYVVLATAVPLLFSVAGNYVENARLSALLSFAGLIASVAVQALFVYSLLFLRTKAAGAFAAVRASIRFGRAHFTTTALIIFTVILVHQPIDFLLGEPDKVVLKFKPELIVYLLVGGMLLEILTSYFLFAATASVALSRREDPF